MYTFDPSTTYPIPPASSARPDCSVVICTRDRPDVLKNCVRSVTCQSLRPIELIVVDDGCLTEADRDYLNNLCHSAAIPFVYLRKDPPGLPASRNLAVRHARGAIVQFLDDDVVLDQGFLREILAVYATDTEGLLLGVEGTLIEPRRASGAARLFDLVYSLAGWWALPPHGPRPPAPPVFARLRSYIVPTRNIVGATMSFRREVLVQNPFDEGLSGYALGEDRDMSYRLYLRGRLARSLNARAVHHHDPCQRPEPFAFGRMIVRNYTRIMRRNGLTRLGDRVVIGYSLATIALFLLTLSLARPRRYLPQFLGMLRESLCCVRRVLREHLSRL